MKYTTKYLFALLAVYLLSVGSVIADSALVIGIDGCSLLDGNGDIAFQAGSGVTVSAQSANGNVMHTCSADVPLFIDENGKKRTKIWSVENTEGFRCDSPYDDIPGCVCSIDGTDILTDDWHQVVSASGKSKLVCHFSD